MSGHSQRWRVADCGDVAWAEVPVLSRRRAAQYLLGAAVAALAPGSRSLAAPATPEVEPAADLLRLFPAVAQLPAGLRLESSGTRTALAELAGTFRNGRDALQLLADWGWTGNAYRSYTPGPRAAPGTPARVEISLHQFTTSTGAANALPYFAHDRAVALHQPEGPSGLLRPCAATVQGEREVTRYVRVGSLVARVTVVMPEAALAHDRHLALAVATEIALTIAANADGSLEAGDVGCL